MRDYCEHDNDGADTAKIEIRVLLEKLRHCSFIIDSVSQPASQL